MERKNAWREIQERSIALTGKIISDLTLDERTLLAQSLNPAQQALITRQCKPHKPRKPQIVAQNDLIRYRSIVKSLRFQQGRLERLRKEIIRKLRAGGKVQEGLFVAQSEEAL